ncbi:hypothetical protein ESCO_005579 [Escovopsis weberi]|uniref:Uncharacterized protein n=1 Tax=Escovopsis weberi TaxID=150374 RepID=A0A0M8MV56_ESCWE|nr:hypothetical protein ESCO_005579 [Escovopsis weberi]
MIKSGYLRTIDCRVSVLVADEIDMIEQVVLLLVGQDVEEVLNDEPSITVFTHGKEDAESLYSPRDVNWLVLTSLQDPISAFDDDVAVLSLHVPEPRGYMRCIIVVIIII